MNCTAIYVVYVSSLRRGRANVSCIIRRLPYTAKHTLAVSRGQACDHLLHACVLCMRPGHV